MIILFICYKIRPLLNNSGLILNINLVEYKQTRTKINSSSIKQFGAGEGTWTPTDEPLDPKSSASANFATPA